MVKEAKDEIIEELWCIKDKFSSSCDNNIGEFIKTMNKIAVEKGFHGKQINQRKKVETS